MISIDELDEQQKNIFLDIACFFIGFDKEIVIHLWGGHDLFPESAVEVLEQMSLIKIRDDNRLWMHDQLSDLGRDIVRQESLAEPEKRSRVYDHAQAFDVFRSTKEKKDIKAIRLKLDGQSRSSFTNKHFASLPNLRFLQVDSMNVYEITHWKPFMNADDIIHEIIHKGLFMIVDEIIHKKPFILSKLRCLVWHKLPRDFKLASLRELVILDLSESAITENWDGWSQIKMATNLKVLNLTGCGNLKKTPNFSSYVKLGRLILISCISLVEIDRSIGQLSHLVHLDVRYCSKLHKLPNELGQLGALTELFVRLTPIGNIPESFGQLVSLIKLDLCYTRIRKLPHSLGKMKKLQVLEIYQNPLEILPSSTGELVSLTKLDLSDTNITKLPHSVRKMTNLQVLKLEACSLETLPSFIGELVSLTELDLSYTKITELPHSVAKMKNLQVLKLCQTSLETLPSSIGELMSLTELELSGTKIKELPHSVGKMKNLQILRLRSSSLETFPSSIGMLEKLQEIYGEECHRLRGEIPSDIAKLPVLRILKLTGTKIKLVSMLPRSLKNLCFGTDSMTAFEVCSNLSNLKHLELRLCSKGSYDELMEDPSSRWIGTLHNLESLVFTSCCFKTMSEDISRLSKLKKLSLFCRNLRRLPQLPLNLSYLHLCCEKLSTSIDLSNLASLEELVVVDCLKIEEICALEGLENLRKFSLKRAECLKKLPDLTNMKQLRELQVIGCGLTELTGTSESLEVIEFEGCQHLGKMPDLSSFKKLRHMSVLECPEFQGYLWSSHDWRDGLYVVDEGYKCGSILCLKWRRPTVSVDPKQLEH